MSIINWPAQERPRERLLEHGASSLSDAELLAIYLRTGVAGSSAVELARALLSRFQGLRGLLNASFADLTQMRGLGIAKYCQLQATVEMVRRSLNQELRSGQVFNGPQTVKDYLILSLGHLEAESFHVLFLDVKHALIVDHELFQGTLTQASVYPREVVRMALKYNAAAVILAHNHPSGNAQPSSADENLTQALKQALNLVDIQVLDHIIIGGNSSWSFAEQGQL